MIDYVCINIDGKYWVSVVWLIKLNKWINDESLYFWSEVSLICGDVDCLILEMC